MTRRWRPVGHQDTIDVSLAGAPPDRALTIVRLPAFAHRAEELLGRTILRGLSVAVPAGDAALGLLSTHETASVRNPCRIIAELQRRSSP
jgi:hypothetical protein